MKQMNMKNLLLASLLTIIGGTSFAQDRELTAECNDNLGYMVVYAEQGMFRDATDFWNKAISSCGVEVFLPAEWKNSRTIYTGLMKTDTAAQRQKELTDSIYWSYDMEMKYHPSADLAAEYAAKLVKAQSKDKAKIDDLFGQSIHTLKEGLSINEMILYFYHTVTKYNIAKGDEKEAARDYAIEEYLKLSDYISIAKKAFKERGNETAVKGYEKAQGYLDNYFTQLAKDCEMLTEVLGKKVNSFPTNTDEKLAKIQAFLSILERRGCDNSDLYGQLADSSLAIAPTADAYFSQANYYLKKDKSTKAKQYYEKAIEMEGSEGENIDKYHYYYANALSKLNSHRAAASMAKKVNGDEFKGKAYIIIARAIGATANSCGETTFDRKANNWLADDYMKKASALGESYSSTYAKRAPTTEECFAVGKAAGTSIRLSCWGESTTVR